MPHSRALFTLLSVAVLLTGCTAGPPTPDQHSGPEAQLPDSDTVVVAGANAAELAVATSRALYHHAAAVVLVADNDEAAIQRASTAAADLGVPLLVTDASAGLDSALRSELVRLAPDTLVAVGDRANSWARTPTQFQGAAPA